MIKNKSEFIFVLLFIFLIVSCIRSRNDIMYGTYYAKHGKEKEKILFLKDKFYLHIVKDTLVNAGAWSKDSNMTICLDHYKEILDSSGDKLDRFSFEVICCKYYKGVFLLGDDPIYVHESLWDTVTHGPTYKFGW